MCGIFGMFAPRGVSPDVARRALVRLEHRGPDAADIWVAAAGDVVLGHARLKILDLSDAANQPMRSPDGRYTLVFNGEIYNYDPVRRGYRGSWVFRTRGDSEVLLATFAAHGLAAMDAWVGMFAFAIHDAESRTLTLVRDRFGIKPIYLLDLEGGGLAFASEIAALTDLQPSVLADEDTIRTYLETGLYDHTARTFFKGITALEAGTALVVDLTTGLRRVERWYALESRIPDLSAMSHHDLVEEGARRIETAIRDHLVSDVRVGLNVSGGVDSSVLVGIARAEQSDIHLFTQDYEPPYSEAPFVREVAGASPLHLVSLSSDEIRARLAPTMRREGEPFGGVTVVGYDALYEMADWEGVTVLLDGNGVDEAFLGYQRYHTDYVAAAGDGAAWQERAEAYRSFWKTEAPAATRAAAIGRSIDGSLGVAPDTISSHLIARTEIIRRSAVDCDGLDSVKQAALRDLTSEKIPRGLRFNDRMSMARSKELRVPFLDHRVVEFGLGVPTRHLLGAGGSKALFRMIAERWIPASLARAAKRSVQSPQREWLKGPWAPFVREVIGSRSFAERGWIDPKRAGKAFERFCEGHGANSFFIWQWLNLELWAREHLD